MAKNIIDRFGVPYIIIIDNGKNFRSKQVREFYNGFKIKKGSHQLTIHNSMDK